MALSAKGPENALGADWTPESVGFFIQAVLQGSFIFAKAKNGADVARDNLAHLRRYLEMLFPPGREEGVTSCRTRSACTAF